MGSSLPPDRHLLPMKYAVLIDGGFIRRRLGTRDDPFTLGKVTEFLGSLHAHPSLQGFALHRIYWYDANPLERSANRPLRGGRVNFGTTPQANAGRALLRQLCELPHVSVRRGELVFRGWRVRQSKLPEDEATVTLSANDLEPDIHQKGVDMRIGLDIAALTMKHHADVIVLVAGDSDFVPAMKLARREGAKLYLVTLGHVVRGGMVEHADLLLDVPAATACELQSQEMHAA